MKKNILLLITIALCSCSNNSNAISQENIYSDQQSNEESSTILSEENVSEPTLESISKEQSEKDIYIMVTLLGMNILQIKMILMAHIMVNIYIYLIIIIH